MKEKQLSLAFNLVAMYAKAQGWIPIGHKVFTVGEWRIEVNGTREVIGKLSPYHALVENQKYLGAMVMHAYGGSVGGYKDAEKEFIDAMRAALDALKKEKVDVEPPRVLGIP